MSTVATDYLELALKLREALTPKKPDRVLHKQIVEDVRQLILSSRKITRATEREQTEIVLRLSALLDKYGITVFIQHRPDGEWSCLALKLPSGETNDLGGNGWQVPR